MSYLDRIEMSNDSAEEISEDLMQQEDEKVDKGIVSTMWKSNNF